MIAVIPVLLGVGFAIIWISPPLLSWVAAVSLARKDAIRAQRMSKTWWLSRFDGE